MGIDSMLKRVTGKISKATALRRLEELRAGGLVERTGKARATRYLLTTRGRETASPQQTPEPKPVSQVRSSRLEGNTFSLLETDRLLALGRSGDPTRVIEARMILNHKEAIEYLVDAPSEIGFNRYTILNLHAILAVYELNRVELLRDVFARAYRSSAGRYSEARRATKMPDILGLTYHEAVRGAARSVVQGRMDKANAAEHIRRWSLDQLPVADRARVVELVEAGLLSLHDGNFAKYRVSPLEFAAWHAVWTREP